MKKRLKTTQVPEIELKDLMDTQITTPFKQYYEYSQNLGVGSFGYVVQVKDLETGEDMALKVSILVTQTDCGQTELKQTQRHQKRN